MPPVFLGAYVEQGIYARDPFVSLDEEGVGELVELAAERGRATRPDIKLGICGEHGGDPASISFCERVGLDYVSASPLPCADRAPCGGAIGVAAQLAVGRRAVAEVEPAAPLARRIGGARRGAGGGEQWFGR